MPEDHNVENSLAPVAPPLDATEVRFSIRSLLVATAVIAVVTTALGAFIRHFPADARFRLTIYWGVLAALFVAIVAYCALQRRRAERQAGHVLGRFTPHSYVFARAPGIGIILAGSFCLMLAPAVWVLHSFILGHASSLGWFDLLNPNSIYCATISGAGISILWWRRILVAENGLIIRNRFVPWEECQRWYWDACNKDVVVIMTGKSTALTVPAEKRAELVALLEGKIKANTGARLRHPLPAGEGADSR